VFELKSLLGNKHARSGLGVRRMQPITRIGRGRHTAIGLSLQMDRRCGGVRDRILGINSSRGCALRLSVIQEISRTR